VVGDLAVKDVRHCLDGAMRVPCDPLRLLGRIDQRTHIVEEQGRVGVTERQAALPGPPDRYSGVEPGQTNEHKTIAMSAEEQYRTLLVHRHFPWFKAKTGYRDSSMLHQGAVPKIGATESEGEPHY
jgi:hypothetical protein